jgi:hypothetical protein
MTPCDETLAKIPGAHDGNRPSLPHPQARQRLAQIARSLTPAYQLAQATMAHLMGSSLDETWVPKVNAAKDSYWQAVAEHLDEIAHLTNNSASTVASVFRPSRDTMGLGGVTPPVLERMANGTGAWN